VVERIVLGRRVCVLRGVIKFLQITLRGINYLQASEPGLVGSLIPDFAVAVFGPPCLQFPFEQPTVLQLVHFIAVTPLCYECLGLHSRGEPEGEKVFAEIPQRITGKHIT